MGRGLYSRKISRREFLALTGAQAAGLAAGSFLVGGLVGYFIGSLKKPREVYITSTETKTETTTEYLTETRTAHTTEMITETKTSTTTKQIPVFAKLAKEYSPSNQAYEVSILVGTEEIGFLKDVRAFPKYPSGEESELKLSYKGRRSLEVEGRREMDVFEGSFFQ